MERTVMTVSTRLRWDFFAFYPQTVKREEKNRYLPSPFSQSVNSKEWTARSTPYGPISVLLEMEGWGGRGTEGESGRREEKIITSQTFES